MAAPLMLVDDDLLALASLTHPSTSSPTCHCWSIRGPHFVAAQAPKISCLPWWWRSLICRTSMALGYLGGYAKPGVRCGLHRNDRGQYRQHADRRPIVRGVWLDR